MNIFVVDQDPVVAARQHCDKHVVKMILEYGQMLSTAHRLLDGKKHEWIVKHPETGKDKKITEWLLPGEEAVVVWKAPFATDDPELYVPGKLELRIFGQQCYRVAHANHPCSVWVRETRDNYAWMFAMFLECLAEYTRRYGKEHSACWLLTKLSPSPGKIPHSGPTPFAQAMPEEYKHADPVEAYRNFYAGTKSRFARWTNSPVPDWFTHRMEGQDVSFFSRTRAVD